MLCDDVPCFPALQESSEALVVCQLLHGHKDRVNCVRWITWRGRDRVGVVGDGATGRGHLCELLSGSADSSIRVWGRKEKGEVENHSPFYLAFPCTGHILLLFSSLVYFSPSLVTPNL